MKRYKYIGLLLLAGLAAACQKDSWKSAGDNYSTEAILFTSPYTVTRSTEMRYGDFDDGDQVGVLGYCPASDSHGEDVSFEDWENKKMWATPDVFYNQPLMYRGRGTWDYSWNGIGHIGGLHPWYENEDYTYAFFAYYPYAEVQASYWGGESEGTILGEGGREMGTIELSGANEKGDPTITYTLPHEGEDTRSELALNVVPDFMLAYNTENHTRSDGAVSLNFRHMLCAFEFEVNNYNTYSVTINSLRFTGKNFYKSFTITGQEQNYTPNSDRYSGYFNLLPGGAITCKAATSDEDGNITPSNVKVGGSDPIDLLFIPDADGKITAGTCSVSVQMAGGSTERTQNLKDGMSFRPGTRSIFSINIVGDNFVIQVRADNTWSDGGDSNIYFD